LERIFAYYHEALDPDQTLVVDGLVPRGPSLSHWPGNRTPPQYRADTTTEMALRLAEDSRREEFLAGVRWVSNNHFDTDGLLSVWAVLHPQEALRHRRFLVDAARAGDFGTFTSADAVKFDLLVTAFGEPGRSPLRSRRRGESEPEWHQGVYDHLLASLPDLLYSTRAHRELWEEPFESIVHSFERVRDGGATIREYPGSCLSVIETEEDLEPMARFDSCRYHRILTALRDGRGYRFELAHHIFSWFDTVTPPRGARVDLTPFASQLNAIDPSRAGRWTYTGNDDLAARLFRVDDAGSSAVSGLPLARVEEFLVTSLRSG
jgi:uncharacterized protein DUF6687